MSSEVGRILPSGSRRKPRALSAIFFVQWVSWTFLIKNWKEVFPCTGTFKPLVLVNSIITSYICMYFFSPFFFKTGSHILALEVFSLQPFFCLSFSIAGIDRWANTYLPYFEIWLFKIVSHYSHGYPGVYFVAPAGPKFAPAFLLSLMCIRITKQATKPGSHMYYDVLCRFLSSVTILSHLYQVCFTIPRWLLISYSRMMSLSLCMPTFYHLLQKPANLSFS